MSDDVVSITPADPTPKPWRFVVGVDLGMLADFSAIVVVKALRVPFVRFVNYGWGDPPSRPVRGFDIEVQVVEIIRPPLGTAYHEVTDLIRRVIAQLPPLEEQPLLVADETGVGRPVIEQMRQAGLSPIGVTLTGGANAVAVDRWHARVPKRQIVSRLQVLLQSGRLKIARSLPLAEVLVAELAAFRAKLTEAGSERFEAHRERDHDDVLLALGLAAWAAEIRAPRPPVRTVPFNLFAKL